MLTRELPERQHPPVVRQVLTVPVPEPAPPAWSIPGASFYWMAPDGTEMVGLGIAAEIRTRGANRFRDAQKKAESLFAGLQVLPGGEPGMCEPRLFGGLSFAPGSADGADWSDFGDAWFLLPRALYRRQGNRGWLTLISDGGAVGDQAAAIVKRLLSDADERVPAPPSATAIDELAAEQWNQGVHQIQALIGKGATEKIVFARRTRVELNQKLEASSILAELDQRHGNCYRFALSSGDSLFVGASPERLVSLRGLQVKTESLAGSIAGSTGQAAETLLGNLKERGEQEVVTRAVAKALRPLCDSLQVAAAPVVHALRDVTHLRTPVVGRLSQRRHLLEVAEALHPTPAVAGEPRQLAMDWIAGHEPCERGWYAGPIGWFDGRGEGEFAVAIRSGLAKDLHINLWAGAGIVAESVAESEYAETGIKQQALLNVFRGQEPG